ncbi:uncharacterized protein J3R85_016634 [Psidium guajava]|nr:uncharacterized protein J3R85_016634 [Psidium guajava]
MEQAKEAPNEKSQCLSKYAQARPVEDGAQARPTDIGYIKTEAYRPSSTSIDPGQSSDIKT